VSTTLRTPKWTKFKKPRSFVEFGRTEEEQKALDIAAWSAEVLLGNSVLAKKLWDRGAEMLPVQPVNRAAGESLNPSGGFVVPTSMTDQIITHRAVAGVGRRYATAWTMTSDEPPVPRRVTAPTVGFIGENTVIPEGSMTFDLVTLTAQKLAAFLKISSELSEDNAIDLLGTYLPRDCANGFAAKEDELMFNADGTSTYNGFRGILPQMLDGAHAGAVAAASGHNTAATLDLADLVALMGKLPEYAWPNARFYCSGYAAAVTFQRLGAAGGGTSGLTFAGYPIVATPQMLGNVSYTTKCAILFGDMAAAAAIGSARALSVQSATGRFLDQDAVAVRATERFALNVHGCGDAVTPGPLVALVGTA
jgi:HK97 family phage major capsid protein